MVPLNCNHGHVLFAVFTETKRLKKEARVLTWVKQYLLGHELHDRLPIALKLLQKGPARETSSPWQGLKSRWGFGSSTLNLTTFSFHYGTNVVNLGPDSHP
jgi:hypothetical protein